MAVYDGSTLRVIVDGVTDPGITDRTGPIDTANAPVLIGDDGGSAYAFAGALDEVRVSNVARDEAYALAQYRVGAEDVLVFSAE
jgi:hypothetical protein